MGTFRGTGSYSQLGGSMRQYYTYDGIPGYFDIPQGVTQEQMNALFSKVETDLRAGIAPSYGWTPVQLQQIQAQYPNINLSELWKGRNVPPESIGQAVGQAQTPQGVDPITGEYIMGPKPVYTARQIEQWEASGIKPQPGTYTVAGQPETQTVQQPVTQNVLGISSNLAPGSTGDDVKKLQDFLVSKGYLTQEQVNTGYGTYGPKTTAAVAKWQKDNNIDTAGYAGYFGPKSIAVLKGQAPTALNIAPQVQQPEATTQQPTTETGQPIYNTGNDQLDQLLGKVQTYLTDLMAQGKAINPSIEIDPNTVQKFLDQASQEIEPYYASQISSINKELNASIGSLQKQYELGKQNAEAQFKQGLSQSRETAAGAGMTFSGVRGLQEQQYGEATNRALQSSALSLQNQLSNAVGGVAKDIGSRNLTGLLGTSFTSPTAQLEGQGSFANDRTFSFYNPTENVIGSLEREKLASIQSRKNELLSAERSKRALNFYNI